jgi:predicted DNA-binding transcriptional regulator AlpA
MIDSQKTAGGERQQPHDSASILVRKSTLAKILDISVRTLSRKESGGHLPAALMIAGSKRWRRSEIEAWVEAGCPPRKTWEQDSRSNKDRTQGLTNRAGYNRHAGPKEG